MGNHVLRRPATLLFYIAALIVLAGCGRGGDPPTRTPVPTWTPTPAGAGAAAPLAAQPQATLPPVQPIDPTATSAPQPPTDTPVPPTNTPTPLPTAAPTETPSPTPIAPTATPTETPTPAPTPTPAYNFVLEAAERFPTESLAADVVRIWLYAYSPAELGLGGYTVRVTHNGAPLAVEEVTEAGVPSQTRSTPGPFTRFTNMNVLFVEPQEGQWEVQLVDEAGTAAGPPAVFTLAPDEITRELYVRYKQVSQSQPR